ncbi:MAG: MFS transporter [Rhizobiaceae bacterium]|nr:MFS transporter [Rhizobiaceae bacterium]
MTGLKTLFVVSFAASLLMIGVGMIVALLPLRVLAFSGSLQEVGYIASYFAISYLLIQLPIGSLADRFGAKGFLISGYLVCTVSGIIFFYALSPETIFAGRFIQGIGEAPIWALGPALLSLTYPNAKGRVIGIYNASIHAGLTIGPLLVMAFFSSSASNIPFLLFAGLCLIGTIIIALLLPAVRPSANAVIAKAPSTRDIIKLLSFRGPLFALTGILLYGACYGIFITVLPASLSLSKGFDGIDIGIYFALFYVAISVSQLIVGPLTDRHGRHVYMIAGLAMAALGIAGFNLFVLPLVYLPLTFASFGLGVFCVSSMAYLNECVPDKLKATISCSYYLAWGLGYFLGPLLIGWMGETEHLGQAYYILALLIGLQTIALHTIKKGSI